MKVLVTGGAGFIGSHLVDVLMQCGYKVVVFDNLSSGKIENVERWLKDENFRFVRGDLCWREEIRKAVVGCDVIFHFAANPDVRAAATAHFGDVIGTFNLLESLRDISISKFIFASSSTVYGEAERIPTPEDYAPLLPISMYGASKLACEALVSSYAHSLGFKAIILRLTNVGPRSSHGVIYDFIMKLRRNPKELEILDDGSQMKSYLYIDDCIDAIMLITEKFNGDIEVFNVGSEDQVNVGRIAEIVVEVLNLKDVKFKFTGGVNGGRGWKGDVKVMLLNASRLTSLGWKPNIIAKHNSEAAVRKAAEHLAREITELGMISVIILSKNNGDTLDRCLESIIESDRK